MGNYVSCVFTKVPSNKIKVVNLYGSVQEFESPIKAAELMLENPQHFVCHSNSNSNSSSSGSGQKSIVAAEEDLELGRLYFLLPMHKLHSPLSPTQMASLAFNADLSKKKVGFRSCAFFQPAKVLPLLGALVFHHPDHRPTAIVTAGEVNQQKDIVLPKLQVDDVFLMDESFGLRTHRSSSFKPWKPVLETVIESPRLLTR